MSDGETNWLCSSDDGRTRAEVSVVPGEVVICLWRCEGDLEKLHERLKETGLSLEVEWQGPCRHEARSVRVTRKDLGNVDE